MLLYLMCSYGCCEGISEEWSSSLSSPAENRKTQTINRYRQRCIYIHVYIHLYPMTV